jgi:hypothetical protein
MRVRWTVWIVLTLACSTVYAQEGQLQSDFRRESEHVKEDCGSFSFKSIASCGQELFTDHPLHIAAGSIAPQNGFGLGAAFVTHYTPNENWRLSWDADAVGSFNGSYRAGAYMKIIHTPPQQIHVTTGTSTSPKKSNLSVHPYTVFNFYAQTISLNKLFFFGEGPDSTLAGQSVFGITQTILGGSVIKPVYEWAAISKLNLALLGEVNARFVSVRGNSGESSPTIGQLYNEATAPGLSTQPAFLQLGEGIRLEPNLFSNHLQLNYLVNFQQFFAPSNSAHSFRRWTVDLGHNFPLYRNSISKQPKDINGPDECASAVGATACPSVSRNRTGTVGLRLLISESAADAGSVVPFYFQPTLGGSDIDGNAALSSFQDYRFRAPNLLLLRESFEHSLWGPVGFSFAADEGKVALTRGTVDFGNLRHSFSTGLTLRAGGFPQVFLLFAWGGGEGHHTIASMNTSLLGGSARPSLY